MKILNVVPGLGTTYGGPSIAILNLSTALAQQGIQVDIVSTNANGTDRISVPTETWISQTQCRIQYFPCWYLKDYKISPRLSKWLWKHVRDYDVVNTHAVFSASLISAYRSCQHYRVPYIIHPHGMLENWALNYKRWKKQPYYKLVEEAALRKSYAVRVLAQSEVESIDRLNTGAQSVLIPNGIWRSEHAQPGDRELLYQHFPETRNKPLILFLGRIDPKKGLDLLAQAFAAVRQQFSTAHLVLAGPDNIGFTPKVEAYFTQVNCLSAVTFTGMLTGDMKQAALAAAQVYTAPSYSEGFSMSVLEGMASGLPCVITTGCNFPEAAAAQVAHVVEIEATAIAKALIYCLRDPEAAQAMGQRARQFVFEHYSWETIGKQMLNVYQEIIAQPKAVVSANR